MRSLLLLGVAAFTPAPFRRPLKGDLKRMAQGTRRGHRVGTGEIQETRRARSDLQAEPVSWPPYQKGAARNLKEFFFVTHSSRIAVDLLRADGTGGWRVHQESPGYRGHTVMLNALEPMSGNPPPTVACNV